MSTTGSLSLKHGALFYTLYFPNNGWLAAELVQYLKDVLAAHDRPIAILKFLGYTIQIDGKKPGRRAQHWVEIDVDTHRLTTNSDMIRKAVDQVAPNPDDPYTSGALKRLYEVLDEYDFTVELVS